MTEFEWELLSEAVSAKFAEKEESPKKENAEKSVLKTKSSWVKDVLPEIQDTLRGMHKRPV